MKKLSKIIVVLVALCVLIVFGLWYLISVPVWTQTIARDTFSSPNRLRQHVIMLSEEIGGRPYGRPDRLDEAAEYIFDQFTALGTPRFQTYDVGGQTYKNVVLRVGGTHYCEDQLFVVGAHYDT